MMRIIRPKNFKPQKIEASNQYKNERQRASILNEQKAGLQNISKPFIISNREYCERRERLTKGINGDLDSRDRQFLLVFETVFNTQKYRQEKEALSPAKKLTEKFKEPQHLALKKAIFDYVSEVCQNISSISFKFLNNGDLGENQAKAFASKTILANIQSVFTDIKTKFCSFLPVEEVNEIMGELTLSIDDYISQVFTELANHYPQAPPVGATARMKEVIVGVNRSQDQSNDLIFANKISIDKYFQNFDNPEDFMGFVMEVINKAIQITSETVGEEEETIAQKYHYFTENLFAFANFKDCKGVINQIKNSYSKNSQNELFYYMFSNKKEALQPRWIQQINQAKQDWRQQARKEHKYGIAQKIPTYVKPFSNADIKQGNFTVHNSSVLRVMTKWAEYLQDIFQKPQVEIAQRLYDFKDYQNELIHLDESQALQIIKKLAQQYQQVKEEMKEMQSKNTLFQSFILSQSQRGSTYLKRFTQVRVASSQINAFTIQFTRKYLCVLIYHLVRASSKANLVSFRVGDLLRSKLQCNQRTFINVINTLSLLDESKQMEGMFKLVRVKNKLNIRDNNVLINYMFMGKVQCELQLSIQKMDKKDQNYYAFCHFLYELTRGKLGVLTECATIVCQHDPIVSASNDTYYRPKCYQFLQKKQTVNHKIHQKSSNIYQCSKCGLLRIRENLHLFCTVQNQTCNQCIAKSQNPEDNLNVQHEVEIKNFQIFINESLKEERLIRIRNYGEIENGKYIISVKNGKTSSIFRLYRAWKPKDETQFFLVQVDQNILSSFDQENFDFGSINYFDISAKKKKNIELNELTYYFQHDVTQQAFQTLGIRKDLLTKLNLFFNAMKKFRIEKNLIKYIKFKSEIIDIRKDKEKLQVLEKVVNAYHEKQADKILWYKKYNNIEWQHINHIKIVNLSLQKPPLMLKLTNCKSINLQRNKIEVIDVLNQSNLEQLNLNTNKLKQIMLEDNDNLTQLTLKRNLIQKIDLKYNTKLTHLALDNNQLKQIDLSNLVNLTYLSLSKNKLHKIDLKSNTKLNELWVANNQLSQIDLSNNTSLEQLFMESNLLQQIDLSSNRSLKNLYLTQNQLKQITIKNSHDLTNLKLQNNCLKQIDLCKNTNLKEVNIRENQLEQIDLSLNPIIKNLYLKKNNLKHVICHLDETGFADLELDNQYSQQCQVKLLYDKTKIEKSTKLVSSYQKKYAGLSLTNTQNCKYTFELIAQIGAGKRTQNSKN